MDQTSSGWSTPSWCQTPFLSNSSSYELPLTLKATSLLSRPLVPLSEKSVSGVSSSILVNSRSAIFTLRVVRVPQALIFW